MTISNSFSSKLFDLGYELEMYFPFYTYEEKILPNLKKFLSTKYTREELKFFKKMILTDDKTLGDALYHEHKIYYPKELITPYFNDKFARVLLRDIFSWMNTVGAKTSVDCGLHLNLSFKDRRKVSYYQLLKTVNQKRLLHYFGRMPNPHAQSTDFLLRQEKFNLKENLSTVFNEILYKSKILDSIIDDFVDYKNFNFDNLEKIINKKNFSDFLNTQIKNIVTEHISDILSGKKKNHAIVEKHNLKKQIYYEFRIVGNENYQLKYDLIAKTLLNLEKAMFRSSLIKK